MSNENKLVFLCGARDFHAMDWYKSAKELLSDKEIIIVTDLIAGEGFKEIITSSDNVYRLLILDKFLLRKQSELGDKWRNLLKLLFLPIQITLLRKFARKNPDTIFHAHAMYYLVLARAAGVTYVGTPQGSDILVKPKKSLLFNKFAKYGLKGAKHITVDSINMEQDVQKLVNRKATIIQNGIDIAEIQQLQINHRIDRKLILSIRGLTALYRIEEILDARSSSEHKTSPLTFVYPFCDEDYFSSVKEKLMPIDKMLGRQDRMKLYELLIDTKLAISIPVSDSSPRSVYESIFCGAAVAITYHPYYELLPACMKSRIIIIKLDDINWFSKALSNAEEIIQSPFIPSEAALELFDQRRSFMKMKKLLFN